MTSKLIDAVLEQIVKDVESGDLTAIEELIADLDHKRLCGFLSEETLSALQE
jgi:phage gp29-like protein